MPKARVQAEVEAGRIAQPLALPRIGDEIPLGWADRFTGQALPHRE